MKFLLDAVPEDVAADDEAVEVDVTAGRSGNHRGNTRTHTDSRMITLTDGTQIEYDASFHFP